MPTLTLNIDVKNADASRFAATGQPQKCLTNASVLLKGLAAGAVVGSVDAQVSSSDPVAASGTVTVTYASIAAADTLVVGGVTLTCESSGANGTTQFNKETDATTTAANIATTINANTTLKKHVVASSASGVVTVTTKLKGSIGNLIVMSATGTGMALVQLSGGTGGPENTAVSYGR